MGSYTIFGFALEREKGGEREHRLLLWVRKMLRRGSTFLGESRLCAIAFYKKAGIMPDRRVYRTREKSGVFRFCQKSDSFWPAQKVDTCLFSFTNAACINRAELDMDMVIMNTDSSFTNYCCEDENLPG